MKTGRTLKSFYNEVPKRLTWLEERLLTYYKWWGWSIIIKKKQNSGLNLLDRPSAAHRLSPICSVFLEDVGGKLTASHNEKFFLKKGRGYITISVLGTWEHGRLDANSPSPNWISDDRGDLLSRSAFWSCHPWFHLDSKHFSISHVHIQTAKNQAWTRRIYWRFRGRNSGRSFCLS